MTNKRKFWGKPVVFDLVAALLAAGLGLLTRFLLLELCGVRAPYMGFLPWIIAAGILCGSRAAVFTVGMVAIVMATRLEPTTLLHTRNPLTGLFLFICTAGVIIGATEWGDRVRRRMRATMDGLQESEERLRLALEAGDMGTWEWMISTDVFVGSPGFAGIHGRSPHSKGTLSDALSTIHSEDRENVWAAVHEAVKTCGDYRVEYRVTSEEKERWIDARGRVLCDAAGKAVRMTGVCMDVSQQKEAELKVRASQQTYQALAEAERTAREVAEHAGQVKDQFLAMLSHELRTPLTPVLMTVCLLEANPTLPAAFREDIASIRRSVELEARLIDDLLDLTRLARGKIRYEFQPVDVHLLIRSAISICCGDGKHEVIVDLAADSSYVQADPARMQQVFWNLLNNAWKFTPPGGKIAVRTVCEGERVKVSVSDNGCGMERDLLPRVFDAFEQGDAIRARRFGGLGLGLAICKALVKAHNGGISVTSDGPGLGATFTVDLPFIAQPIASGTLVPPRRSSGTAGPRPLRMLLIEDHAETLKALTRLLSASGHEIRGAASVADGLRAAEGGQYDLVISDLGLPDGNGFDLMSKLQELYGLRGIALSGYGMEEDIARSMESGFREHLVKPVDMQRLQEVITRVSCEDSVVQTESPVSDAASSTAGE